MPNLSVKIGNRPIVLGETAKRKFVKKVLRDVLHQPLKLSRPSPAKASMYIMLEAYRQGEGLPINSLEVYNSAKEAWENLSDYAKLQVLEKVFMTFNNHREPVLMNYLVQQLKILKSQNQFWDTFLDVNEKKYEQIT